MGWENLQEGVLDEFAEAQGWLADQCAATWVDRYHNRLEQWRRYQRERWASLPADRKAEILERARARRVAAQIERRAATVYRCQRCGSQWSPAGRIPSRSPKWCSIACKSAARRAAA